MLAIALVAAGAVLIWARVSVAGGAARAEATEEPLVPASLADGRPVPEAPEMISRRFDEPVVAALALDELPPGFPGCDGGAGGAAARMRWAVVTPDALIVTQTTDGAVADVPPGEAGEDAVTLSGCTARWEAGAWHQDGGWATTVVENAEDGFGGGVGGSCCDENGLAMAWAEAAVPAEAAWAVQARAGYWLALPTGKAEVITLAWKVPEREMAAGTASAQVVWLDAGGEVLREDVVGG